MGKFITKIETTAKYNNIKNNLILPNVSLISESNEIQSTPYHNESWHDYVEIAGIKWAKMNLGANNITDGGLYFQWGDTQGYTINQIGNGTGQKLFTDETYKYVTSVWNEDWGDYEPTMTKYTSTNDNSNADDLITLELSDDGAYNMWGGNWRIPSIEDFQTLYEATYHFWISNCNNTGIDGVLFVSKSDINKQLFLPNVGYISDDTIEYNLYYWTNHVFVNCGNLLAQVFRYYDEFDISDDFITSQERTYGIPIRPVLNE